jgi:3-hydroxyacyl-[acyl-carrier-protein] dehydratase
MVLNSNQIQEIIPHRYPFLLIDRIIELIPGDKAVAIKNVTVNEQFFIGHFPEKHVMPGVLIVEALAQAGAVTILSLDEHKGKLAYFAGIDKCKFKKQVLPGDQLVLESQVINKRGNIGIAEGTAYVEGEVVCKAILKFAISE